MRLAVPLILIAIALAVLFIFVTPLYDEFSALREEVAAYDQALGNSKALEDARDKLTAQYSSFRREDLVRLEKLLPGNVDNIRLILEIEQLASPYGMLLRNVQYNAEAGLPATGVVAPAGARREARKDYGVLELEFTTSGSYSDFLNFIRDLENNLRIVDISAVDFSSEVGTSINKTIASEIYDYNLKVKTYWLRN